MNKKIYVANLPFHTTERELNALFSLSNHNSDNLYDRAFCNCSVAFWSSSCVTTAGLVQSNEPEAKLFSSWRWKLPG